MDWLTLDGVHWLGVLLATLAAFAVGAAWYSPTVYGTPWMKHVGLTPKKVAAASGAGLRYGITFVAAALTAILINVLMVQMGVDTWLGGLVLGAVLGLVFRMGTHFIHNGFALRPIALSLIDGGHDMVAMAAAGAIIGAFL